MWGRCWHCLFVVVSLNLALCLLALGQNASRDGASTPAPELSSAGLAPTAAPARVISPRLSGWPSLPPQSVSPGVIGLPQMVRAAGFIFSGRVLSIAREPAFGGASPETIALTFHIDRALRGTTTGKDLTIHEWAGAWSAGQRYRIGERVLLFLYPPSKLGLTSCVAGPVGRFSLDSWGRVLLSGQHLAAPASDPVLGGKSRVSLDAFARAVRDAGGEERVQP
ncbi:MAG: hypothetical protein WB510_00440 [Candidatus Sulfotelmatobacter sp.]